MTTNQTDLAIYVRTFFDCGVDRIIVNLTQGFIAKGLKVDIVLNRASEATMLQELPAEVELVDLKEDRLFRYLPKLIQYLRKKQPKSLLSAGHTSSEVAILAKRLAGVSTKVVVSEHSQLSLETRTGDPLGNRMKSRLIPMAVRFLYPFANGIIAVSHGVAQDLAETAKLPLESIEVIYNPTIMPSLVEASGESVEQGWFSGDQPPVILAVGRLEPQKDLPTLIRAFAQVRRVQPAKLMILGSGQEKSKLKGLIQELGLEEDVEMPGFVSNPYAYMAKASVFVLSSMWEGLPTVLIEALAVGVPVVSTDCPSGPAEILDGGKYGELVPVGECGAIAEAILRVLSGQKKAVDSDWLDQFTLARATERYVEALGLGEVEHG